VKNKTTPNKLSLDVIDYLQREYQNKTLNITRESKKLGVSRQSIYRILRKKNLIRRWKKRGLWGKINEFCYKQFYWNASNRSSGGL
jgi:hypothetical protein